MNKKILASTLSFRNRILPVAAAFFVSSGAFAGSISLESPRSEGQISLESSQRVGLALQNTTRPASAFNLIGLSSEQPRFALNQPASELKELILDGPHPPEPAEPAQPKTLKKLLRATKPTSVPAIPKATKAVTTKQTAGRAIAIFTPVWTALGPAPIPNGQTAPADANGISLTQAPVSGRTISIVIDPSDPNIAYVGTAQGGLYRTLNGGSTWTPLLDNALSLAVGSIVFDPADATFNTILVGTGESNFSGDSYAGVGIYKITGAKGGSPVLSGPYNQD
ncbi:MAG: hypothetical protein QOC55_2392, partial [Thermoleophilaceae bacterium]|nr:hypothetical protein [Thermoleophilaceae bacterium]